MIPFTTAAAVFFLAVGISALGVQLSVVGPILICCFFFDSLRESHSQDNAPTIPKTDQSLSSLFLELGSAGFGGMPEQQAICKNQTH
jgi:hypothetical protein